ncbi:MAG: hypothetical protein GF384_07295 [Elusimicrobia bacterium]|nr:hypothetical protein [Elusimicrobiota bacterium]
MHRFFLFVLILLVSLQNVLNAETFWDMRKRAYERLKKDQKESVSSPVRKKRGYQGVSYTSSKENFGIKKVKELSSPSQYRNPYNITIPVEFGDVTEILHNQGKPLIINIQDYHCNYQAQKQIAYILEELIVHAGLKLIMVEGNSKDASLKHLRSMATRERRIEVAEDYLRRGMISGEEYLDIISEYDFKPLGVEDKELYMKNLDSFLEIDTYRKDALAIIDDFKVVIENLKPKVYSDNVYKIDRERQKCDTEQISFEEYSTYLLNLAKKHNVYLALTYDNIKRVLRVAEMGNEIDFDKVNRERDACIAQLGKKLSENELARLLFKAAEFKNKRISANDFHGYLDQLPHGNWKREYPELVKYIEYLDLHASIDVLDLFSELDLIEDAIKNKLFKNDEEKMLSKLARNVEILYGFFALELIPRQYSYFKAMPDEFRIPEWRSFLARMVMKHKLSKNVPVDISVVVNNMDRTDRFYQLAKQRDHVFLRKIKGYIQQEKAHVAALITGGFHTSNLSTMLHDAGYSFMTVIPVVTEETDEELYHSVLKYKTELLKKAENQE